MRIKKLGQLFQQHQHQLYVCAVAITKNRQLAEDAVHDALLAVAQTPKEPRDLLAYLFTSVRHQAIKCIKQKGSLQAEWSDVVDLTADDPAMRYQQQQTLKQLEQLATDEQQLILMKAVGGLTFKEIALSCDQSINTMNQPEDILKSLTLKPPSADYQSKAAEILGSQKAPDSSNQRPVWQWAMAAALLVSLTLNVVQYQSRETLPDHPQQAHAETSHEPSINPGGYSIVQNDESPDGMHHSFTIIWENKS